MQQPREREQYATRSRTPNSPESMVHQTKRESLGQYSDPFGSRL